MYEVYLQEHNVRERAACYHSAHSGNISTFDVAGQSRSDPNLRDNSLNPWMTMRSHEARPGLACTLILLQLPTIDKLTAASALHWAGLAFTAALFACCPGSSSSERASFEGPCPRQEGGQAGSSSA